MKVVCYFAAAEGSHADCSVADYKKIWPVMQASVERQGYQLTQLTSLVDEPMCDSVIRYDIDPKMVMYSREIAWLRFLESLPENETAVLVEPDCYLLRQIPELQPEASFLLLERPGKPLPSGFRMARNSAASFYRDVVNAYDKYSDAEKVFHGDGRAMREVLRVAKDCGIPPRRWRHLKIEVRNWIDYTSKLWRSAIAWNFKGWSKKTMLAMADGKMPEMR